MKNTEIFYMRPEDLTPYENNAKRHDEKQIEQIAESIQLFGFNDPVGVDENWMILEGHGRVLAAQKLKLLYIPVFRIEGLTDEQKRAYMLVHNQLTNNTGFDISMLESELEDITDIDMSRFSFLTEESYFDPGKEFEPQKEPRIYCIVNRQQSDEIREWLDSNLIPYVEKDVR